MPNIFGGYKGLLMLSQHIIWADLLEKVKLLASMTVPLFLPCVWPSKRVAENVLHSAWLGLNKAAGGSGVPPAASGLSKKLVGSD